MRSSTARPMARRVAAASTTALCAGVLTAVTTASPAAGVPGPTGQYATVTSTVLRTIDSDACQDMVRLDSSIDLVGLGNEIAAQGYTTPAPGYVPGGTDPVYTNLSWDLELRITGPDNYFETFSALGGYFPSSVDSAIDSVCPDDFGRGRTSPGRYRAEWIVTADASDLCSTAEGCDDYDTLWRSVGATEFVLAYSTSCLNARAKLPLLKKKLRKAKRADDRAQVKKLKPKVSRVRGVIDRAC